MRDLLYQYLANTSGTLSVETILLNFGVAFLIGGIIYVSYRFSHSGSLYSPKFNVSLMQLTLVTTLVMNVIGNNIALSLGMVGALSIVRFRTAIKDSRDTAYIFWGIAVGICCGVSDYLTASIGSVFIFVVLLIFGAVKSNERYLIVIRSNKTDDSNIEQCMLVDFVGKAILRVKNTNENSSEYIYETSSRMIEKNKKKGINYIRDLYELEGIKSVNLICQNEEINR